MVRSLANRTFQLRRRPARSAARSARRGASAVRSCARRGSPLPAAIPLVERFDRRGTEPFELFRSEFGQNSWNPKKTMKSHSIEVAYQKEEKATNDPLYKEGPQKNREGNRRRQEWTGRRPLELEKKNMHKALCQN